MSIQLTLKPCQVAITLVPQELYELSFGGKDSFRDIWDGRKQQKRYQLSLRHCATAEHNRLCESESKPRSCQTPCYHDFHTFIRTHHQKLALLHHLPALPSPLPASLPFSSVVPPSGPLLLDPRDYLQLFEGPKTWVVSGEA